MVLLPWPEVWVLAGWNGWGQQTTDSIYSGAVGVLCMWKNAFQDHQCPCNLPETNGDLSWGPQSPLVYHLSAWHSHLLQGPSQAPWETQGSVPEIGGGRTKVQAFKVWGIPVAISLSGTFISAQGVATDEGKIEAIKNWPTPTNVTEVQSFLGFMGYYPWFIPMFVQVAWPLHKLTSSESADKKATIKWDIRCQQAFNDLKKLCTTAPILAHADFTKPFKLHTDACGTGLGAVLYQIQEDGTKAVISYASRSLNKVESHYPAHKLEFLTLKWAVVEKFHEYLYGSTFNVHTNNTPLTYVLTTAKLNTASHCWVASLANYNFRLHYRAGKANLDADALLRVSWPACMPHNSGTHLEVTAAAVQAVQEAALKGPASPIEANSCDLHVLDAIQDSKQVACMTLEDWHQAQEVDPVLSLVIASLRDWMLGKGQSNTIDPLEISQYRWKHNHLLLKRVSCTGRPGPGSQERPSFSWSYQLHRERLLWEDAMMRLVIWAWNTCLISCMPCSSGLAWLPRQRSTSGSVTHVLFSKPGSQKLPSKTSWPHIL